MRPRSPGASRLHFLRPVADFIRTLGEVAMRDLFTGLVMVLVGVALIVWIIPAGTSAPYSAGNLAHSPAFWPKVLAVILLLAGAALALKAVPQTARNPVAAMDAVSLSKAASWRFWASLALLVPYYAACVQFGLLIPSTMAFVAYGLLAGERRYGILLLSAVLMPLLLTLFFIHLADVLVPLGPVSWLM
ncbi:tripartite tricarboxylate transporter TctB family protein [Spiribacter halobius]|uniref:DUF1468 domain-containing protein n=1 Tax=Sediminicurvatus halobius TaxID=2182432 RepID=A0A2U2N8M5_9GAMM|nr:tripartite tricarboxylate transporter TctB family protein [Spiribacter halobius]PWG65545.1 hypothetical protein DEM34_02055 [Spiribacter halobius]UEX76571.1 tripartite tricarboxylate transporter TctB family protein [Spiribacter halobius]